MKTARRLFNLNNHDNMTLTANNLDNVANQKKQNYYKETTTWIFSDGSALIGDCNNDWQVISNYRLSCDNEQL